MRFRFEIWGSLLAVTVQLRDKWMVYMNEAHSILPDDPDAICGPFANRNGWRATLPNEPRKAIRRAASLHPEGYDNDK